MSDDEASPSVRYKAVEYNDFVYRIPVRRVDALDVLLFSDVQALVPCATALTSSDKLVPFLTDPITHLEHNPKRVAVSELDTVWQAHVPQRSDLDTKLDRLMHHLERLVPPSTNITSSTAPDTSPAVSHTENEENGSDQDEEEGSRDTPGEDELNTDRRRVVDRDRSTPAGSRSPSPPPAFSSAPPPLPLPSPQPSEGSHQPVLGRAATTASSSASASAHPMRLPEGEAPPSYETSILGNIKALVTKLRTYESHIANRHKSPRWLAKRSEWVDWQPESIEQVAYQLVQLEMALLWTAVSEAWIQERETWLTLVASARSERHLAGALISLERHTLVMDESWPNAREGWVNELLEMVVLPLSHG